MTNKGTLHSGRRPHGLYRLLFRAPIWLYRARLGFLMGGRFVMLEHTGRKSGRTRHTVLEVVRYDREADTYVVASGWGERSDWFRNLTKTPEVVVSSGFRRRPARALRLSQELAERELCDYARRHPAAFRALSRMMLGGATEPDCRAAALVVPVVALKVTSPFDKLRAGSRAL